MSRPFRPSFDPAEWIGWFLVGCVLVGILFLGAWCGHMQQEDCKAKGGELVHTHGYKYWGSLCVKPGTVLE